MKLSCYLSEKSFQGGFAPFDYGVFILVGESVKLKDITVDENTTIEWKEDITLEQYKKLFSETFSRIICIAYDGNGESLEYDTLENIINKRWDMPQQ